MTNISSSMTMTTNQVSSNSQHNKKKNQQDRYEKTNQQLIIDSPTSFSTPNLAFDSNNNNSQSHSQSQHQKCSKFLLFEKIINSNWKKSNRKIKEKKENSNSKPVHLLEMEETRLVILYCLIVVSYLQKVCFSNLYCATFKTWNALKKATWKVYNFKCLEYKKLEIGIPLDPEAL